MKLYGDWIAAEPGLIVLFDMASADIKGYIAYIRSYENTGRTYCAIIGCLPNLETATVLEAKHTVESKLMKLGYRYADERIKKALVML